MAFENDYPNRQTIDRESGAYLKFNKGLNHPALYDFSFFLDGEEINFYAEQKPHHNKENKIETMNWTFYQLGIPPHLKEKETEIVDMIKQAMEVYGSHYDNSKYKSVIAVFKSPEIPSQ